MLNTCRVVIESDGKTLGMLKQTLFEVYISENSSSHHNNTNNYNTTNTSITTTNKMNNNLTITNTNKNNNSNINSSKTNSIISNRKDTLQNSSSKALFKHSTSNYGKNGSIVVPPSIQKVSSHNFVWILSSTQPIQAFRITFLKKALKELVIKRVSDQS